MSDEGARRPLTRVRAAGIHLLASAGVAAAVLTVMLAVWYPPPLFEAMGGNHLALILIGVDVAMGPLLTLAVFKAGKRGLKLDLSVIAALQMAALLYGCHIVYLARPAFIVFVKDRFEVAAAVELDAARLEAARYPQFRQLPWSGPLLVAGDWPVDQAERQMLVHAALAGEDLQHFPRYYAPYDERSDAILAKAQPIARLRATEPASARVVDDWLTGSGVKEEDVLYVPLRARNAWVAVLLDRASARPVKMLVAEEL